jgi:hypothetical protein
MAAVAMPTVTNANRKVLKIVVLIALISSPPSDWSLYVKLCAKRVGEVENDTYG